RRQASGLGCAKLAFRATKMAHQGQYARQFQPYPCCFGLVVKDVTKLDCRVAITAQIVSQHPPEAETRLCSNLKIRVGLERAIGRLGCREIATGARGIRQREYLRGR